MSVSPPTTERAPQRPERPKTLLSSSASFQVEDHHHRHQPDTPTTRLANRPMSTTNSRDGTPVRRVGGTTSYSRTPTPGCSIGQQQASGIYLSGGPGGLLYTASMTFTPCANTASSAMSPGPANSVGVGGASLIGRSGSQHLLQQQQQQQQNDFQRCLVHKPVSHRDKEVLKRFSCLSSFYNNNRELYHGMPYLYQINSLILYATFSTFN